MENLNVSGMMKNWHLSKAIAQQSFAEFIRQMRYKCEWNGIEFIQADRWCPSSKTCSNCGTIKTDLKLSDRVFRCECGIEIDRDFNAALNLERYTATVERAVA
jgi:putative transposase